jgi:hypothetical protein
MTTILIIYLLCSWCMFSALPDGIPAWRQIQLSLCWPMTALTAIFTKLLKP